MVRGREGDGREDRLDDDVLVVRLEDRVELLLGRALEEALSSGSGVEDVESCWASGERTSGGARLGEGGRRGHVHPTMLARAIVLQERRR